MALHASSCPVKKYGPGRGSRTHDSKLLLCSLRTDYVCHFKNVRFVLAEEPLTQIFPLFLILL